MNSIRLQALLVIASMALVTTSGRGDAFFDDVESGTNGWSATGLWHIVGNPDTCGNSFSPTHSWYYGNGATCTYNTGAANSGDLVSPRFMVASNSALRFLSWEQTEGTSTTRDLRVVSISTNDGASWIQLFQSVFNAPGWRLVSLDLSAYADQTAQVRFHFETVDAISNDFRGWYVDDVRVTAWNLVWSDEFNSTSVDTNRWSFDIGTGPPYPGWGNSELEYYTSRTQNVYVAGGVLHIVARRESFSGSSYTSARVKTMSLFAKKYGRIEFRAKLPQGQGYWPALWLLPQDSVYGDWPASGEIDVMENQGANPWFVLGSIGYGAIGNPQFFSAWGYVYPDTVTDFHTYVVEWTPNMFIWSVDEELYALQTYWWTSGGAYPAPFDQSFYILMNLAVGGQFGGDPDVTTVFPGEMQVDYVRVYDDGQVTASFSASPVNGLPPLAVSFHDNSIGWSITNRYWDFGDGGTSTEVNPSHTYTNVGSFSVSLTVSALFGTDTLVRTNLITVSTGAPAIWTNTNASGNWSAASNWNEGVVPDFGSTVIFGLGGQTCVVDNVSRTLASITFNRSADFFVASLGGAGLTIDSGITVTTNFTYTISAPVVLGGDNTWSVANGATLRVSGPISGANSITKTGGGALILTGTNTYSGSTIISNGVLAVAGAGLITNTPGINIVNGATLDVSGRTGGGMTLASGQTLKGNGSVHGKLSLAAGSILTPGGSAAGTLTFLNDLVVSNGAVLQYALGTNSALTAVSSNLTLGGTLNIDDAGGFGTGVYPLFTFGGALAYQQPAIGIVPYGYLYMIDTNTAGQVKLTVTFPPTTIIGDAGNLSDRFGNLAPANSIAVLVVDTGDNGFVDPEPRFPLSLGATWGIDDKIVGLWDLAACGCGDGQLLDQTVVAYTGGIAPGQKLQLYWFPSLTLASSTVGVTYYGKYTDTNSPPLDGSYAWQMPVGGAIAHLIFWTAFWGGSNPETNGWATLLASVPLTTYQSWQMQYFGCTGCPQAAATTDPDGDGLSNVQEFLAGTDPTNSASAFRIISIARETDDVLVTWSTAGGRTNAVQAAPDLSGSYSNVSLNHIIAGSGNAITNFLDLGAATNGPSRYYRVRLVP